MLCSPALLVTGEVLDDKRFRQLGCCNKIDSKSILVYQKLKRTRFTVL